METTNTAEGFWDTGVAQRSIETRVASLCRLCLKQRYLVDVNSNPYLITQLVECFSSFLPDDADFPRFVCGECYQLVEITYQFSIRSARTAVLLRSYIHHGGEFPRPEMVEQNGDQFRRAEKRSASPESRGSDMNDERVPKRSRTSKKDKSVRDDKKKSSASETTKRSERKDTKETRAAKKQKSKCRDTKTEQKDTKTSLEYLFGDISDLDEVEPPRDTSSPIQQAEIVSEKVTSKILPDILTNTSYEEIYRAIESIKCMQNNPLERKKTIKSYTT